MNSKSRINDISTLVQEFIRSTPDQYYRLVQPPRQEFGLMFLCSQQSISMSLVQLTYIQTLCMKNIELSHTIFGCYRVYCAGKICFFPGQLYEISQRQKTPLLCAEKSLLSLFVFYTYELKNSFMSD